MSNQPAVTRALEQLRQGATTLNLRGNNIGSAGAKTVAAALIESQTLEDLNLENNNLGDDGAKAMAMALKENRSLISLELQNNKIRPEGAKVMAAVLQENQSLVSLNLRGNKIGCEGAKAMAAALKENFSLASLDLQWNKIGIEGAKAVGAALKENRSLRLLKLQGNKIANEGTAAVAEALKHNCSLNSLDLRSNKIGDDGIMAVAAALQENRSLTSLKLEGNTFGSEGIKAMGAMLKENQSLASLFLSSNKIGDEGVKVVSAALNKNNSLKFIDLGDNHVNYKGAEALATMLIENKSLISLKLADNNIGVEGAKVVAAALNENSSLEILDLNGNNIGVVGAKAVAAVLIESRKLTSLDIGANEIGSEGAKAVAAALIENKSLTSLNLPNNKLGDEGAQAMAAALRENRSLKSLDLQWNDIGSEGAKAVAGALDVNKVLCNILLNDNIPQTVRDQIGSRLMLAKNIADQFVNSAMNAFSKNEKVRWGRAKLMVVGKGGGGKTSTIRTLLNQSFVPEHHSTVGVELKLIRTTDWQEDPRGYQSADLSEALAKQQVLGGRKSIRRSLRKSLARLSGPRTDKRLKPELKVKTDEVAKSFKASVKLELEERGSEKVKEDVSFSIWDYGGQEVFYALHHLFLTKFGVYVIVFDMREVIGKHNFQGYSDYALMEDKETALNTIRFWLDSIRLHANGATFLLVGTYLDALRDPIEDLKLVNTALEGLLPGVKGLFLVTNKTEGLHFHPLDNTERSDPSRRELLRKLLTTTAASQPYVKEEVPLRWSLCLDRMFATNRDYFELDAVYELATSSCGISRDETMDMLELMHELGVIVHLTSTPTLAKYVILQPQWLLDNLSRVVCDPMHMQKHVQKMKEVAIEADIPTDWFGDLDTWEKRGVVSQLLLSKLWGQPLLVGYFSVLMTEMLLASRSPWIGDLDTEGALLVPSLLAPISEDERDDLELQFEGADLMYIELDFFPGGVFQRLVASMVSEFPEGLVEVAQVYANVASIIFDGIYVFLFADTSKCHIIFRFLTDEDDTSEKRRLVSCVELLQSQLQLIDKAFMKQNLNPKLFLSCDGTMEDKSCASISVLAKPKKCVVLSRARRLLPFECFSLFFASRDDAEKMNLRSALQRKEKYDVFLSHAWGKDMSVHSLVCRVSDALEQDHGLSCWLDRNEMQHGDITRIMTQGIDDSKVGVVFVTREYMEKVNSKPVQEDYCRYEFEYLVKRKYRELMIPVVIDKVLLSTSEWIGIFGASWGMNPLYVDMSDGDTQDKVKELHDMIHFLIRGDAQK